MMNAGHDSWTIIADSGTGRLLVDRNSTLSKRTSREQITEKKSKV